MKAALLAVVFALALPAAAAAHPLGNFSVNHQSRVAISADRVDVTYLLDQAEVPTFQQRGLGRGEVLARVRDEVARGVVLEVDGRRVPLTPAADGRIAFPQGQGGLRTTRAELRLSARADTVGSTVGVRDRTYADRVGWKAIVVAPGRGTHVRSSVPANDPTNGLRRYPGDALESPADVRSGRFAVARGSGTVAAPGGGGAVATRPAGGEDGFAGLLDGPTGFSLVLLLAAMGWGAVHALSPGHGKAMVAAYLVGTRGTPRHAVALGLAVTVTHTIGVFALGVVTLALSAYIVPEDLYPWLNLVAGVLVLGVGTAVLRRRRAARRHHHHHHHHHHHDEITWRGLAAMGASAGLVPCPSALVVLLGAIAQHQIALGLVLIVAFSAGLAATLTALGLAVVHSGRVIARAAGPSRLVAALPTASALAIVVLGCVLTLRALPGIA
jgi:ABC-type nickel/cobalt efflux system permease component RcnA